ncbi:hypothetical protein MNV49_003715 [Pseudohyphozyma bogoriensis]|nr:hypothetical protein MNV49_003715 [Pseudohyphozyma bogoriensis]
MASMFSTYLTRLESICPLTPLNVALDHSPPSPPLDDPSSPAKRPRSDSPNSGDLSPLFSSSFSTSPTIASNPTPCQFLRSILSPSSSPPSSRASSRRSSTGCSSKSVRFARCTNASVFPALSGEEYDRTPIVPTCAEESLTLPKRKRDEEEGWIKCVERARVEKEKLKKKAAECLVKSGTECGIGNSNTSVEGVHGLLGSSRFGEDTDESEEEEEVEEEDGMVVDDEEDGQERDVTPPLVHDEASSSEESEGVLTDVASSSPPLCSLTAFSISSSTTTITSSSSSTPIVTSNKASVGFGRTDSIDPQEAEEEERARAEEECEKRKARFGICALGKYTRAEVFQSYDSLGGF